MLSKAKALYQVKLVLDYLPEEEYKLIPKDDLDYIENNFEYDESITIDPSIPLEKQKIDDKSYEILEKIINRIKTNKEKVASEEINNYVENCKESNSNYNAKIENIRLKNIIVALKKENSKIPNVKDLITEYKSALKQKEDEIIELKKNNQDLYDNIQRLPKFIRKILKLDYANKILNS